MTMLSFTVSEYAFRVTQFILNKTLTNVSKLYATSSLRKM